MQTSKLLNLWVVATTAFVLGCITVEAKAAKPVEYLYLDNISDSWFNEKLPFYETPSGKEVGFFKLVLTDSWCLVSWRLGNAKIKILQQDKYNFDRCLNINIYDEVDGYYQVLRNSIEGGVWIKREYNRPSISKNPLIFQTKSVLEGMRNAPTSAFEKYGGLKLRTNPSEDSMVVVDLKGNYIIARATGNFDGLWAEIEVYEVNGHPTEEHEGVTYPKSCASRKSWEPFKTNSFMGWVKALNDDGYPGDFTWNTIC